MLAKSVNSNLKVDKRTKRGKALSKASASKVDLPMSLAHLADSIGYENPHILTHAKAGLKTTDQHAKLELQHVIHHAEQLADHNKKLHKKLGQLPTVKREFDRLNQNKSF